jgi:hypothetical protein
MYVSSIHENERPMKKKVALPKLAGVPLVVQI